VKKIPTFYGTQGFITVFPRACHWSISWARCNQSAPSYHISVISILILYSHLCLCLQGRIIPSFPMKIMYAFLISPISATCPTHLTLFDLMKHTSCEAPHYAVLSSVLPLSSYIQIFSSATCSQTPWNYVLPLE